MYMARARSSEFELPPKSEKLCIFIAILER